MELEQLQQYIDKPAFVFQTDKMTFKSEGEGEDKKYTITGYISTPDIDLYDDLITQKALKSMLNQIMSSTITLDYEHEAWRDDNTILPVGKIVEAKVDNKGLWVKCELNKYSPKFKALRGSIKDGFVNAFSIAFKPLKVISKTIGDTTVRMIEDLQLLNVALTGNPVNQGAVMTGFDMKSVLLKAIDNYTGENIVVPKALITKLTENKMEETIKNEVKDVEVKDAEVKDIEVKDTEAPKAEAEEKPTEAEVPSETPAEPEASVEEKALLAELKANVEKLQKSNAELKSEVKSLKEKEIFKSPAVVAPETKSEAKAPDMLSMVR